jgi:hypothetical protein
MPVARDAVQGADATAQLGIGAVKSVCSSHGTGLKFSYEIGRYFKQPVHLKNLIGCEKMPPNLADFLFRTGGLS